MTNQPLSFSERNKLVGVGIFLAPSAIFIVGLMPVLLLCLGVFNMKSLKSFSKLEDAIDSAFLYYKLIICSALLIFFLLSINLFVDLITGNYSAQNTSFIPMLIIISLAAYIHIMVIKDYFLLPLKNHSEWVINHGVFSQEAKPHKEENIKAGVEIIQNKNLKNYSVADELIKWAKLKDDGLVSDEEFEEARSKLLNRA